MGYDSERDAAEEAAREAGRIMQDRRDHLTVDRKETHTDVVTDADRAAQEAVVETLNREFPDDGILAEEDGLTPDGEERVWIVDPIDGTNNYTHGFPYYCCSIGMRDGDDLVVGVVHDPVRDNTFAAAEGEGATLDGEPIRVSDVDAVEDAMISLRLLPPHMKGDVQDEERAILEDIVDTPSSFRSTGAMALDLCQVAAGRFDGNMRISTRPWDAAAGIVLIEEAGGAVRVRDSVVGGHWELVASNGGIQDELEEVMDRHVER